MRLYSIATAISLTLAAFASAQAAEIDPFVGSYQGEATLVSNGKESHRDLSVKISKLDDGFRLNWQTTTQRADGSEKTKSYTIDFFPSNREHIYQSAMKANLFGGREPLDPMKGDPYVWSYFKGDTLVVHALIINEEGGYEMQTYDRTLVKEGLALKFNRIRNGEPLKQIETILKRTDG